LLKFRFNPTIQFMSEQPLVSIITLNWNTTAVTCEFLTSILEQNTY